MKKNVPLVALAAAAALLVVPAGCHRHRADPARVDRFVTAHLDDALDDLDATAPQRTRVHELKDKLLNDGTALRQGQRDARRELVAQWDSERPDPTRVHALVDARIEALRAFAHEAADAGLELHGMLTPEQRAKVSKKIHRRLDD
jgi:Spy/CpxP family protein refolding chaperone